MLVTIGLGLLMACSSDAPSTNSPDETVAELAAATGEVIVDVRSKAEFAAGHVPGAVNIELGALDAYLDQLKELDSKPGPMHIVCQSGGRSKRAATRLSAEGFDVVNVLGGTSAWENAGHKVEKP